MVKKVKRKPVDRRLISKPKHVISTPQGQKRITKAQRKYIKQLQELQKNLEKEVDKAKTSD